MVESREQKLLDQGEAIARACAGIGQRSGEPRQEWTCRYQSRGLYPRPRGRLPIMTDNEMLIECIPNVSEGRRPQVVKRLAEVVADTPGVTLLDRTSDSSHHRSVLTFAGERHGITTAVLALFEPALAAINLRHGAASGRASAPSTSSAFVPWKERVDGGVRRTGDGSGRESRVALRPAGLPLRRRRAAARNGAAWKISAAVSSRSSGDKMQGIQPGQPDFGPSTPHATASAW